MAGFFVRAPLSHSERYILPCRACREERLRRGGARNHLEPVMGDLLFPDFATKDRRYTKGGGIDDMKFPAMEDTAPSEMPPVWPSFEAPEKDGA